MCGTAEFLAPEMVFGSRYNTMIDWWMLGITLYELASGKVFKNF
jgi:serine/threonine protein kinase